MTTEPFSTGSDTIDTDATSELTRRLEGLSRLVEVTHSLAAEIDLTKLLDVIARQACRALDCDRASVFQYDGDTHELFTVLATELEVSEIRIPLDRGIAGHVARTRQLANVPDPAADPRWNPDVDRATGYRTTSILAAPLLSPHTGNLIGVISLLNKNNGGFDALDEELLTSFSQHAGIAIHRAHLVEELRRQGQIQASLNVAREVQRGFMPDKLPSIPGYEVDTWWFPNEAVGGDYCDVVPLRDGRMGLVIADVSGHGLGPSLLMASVRAALRALILEHTSTEVLLNMLSHALLSDLQDGRFITMVLAALDAEKHCVEFANAGHAPALHYRAASDSFHELEATGLPLGVLDRPEYPSGPPFQMEVGDLVLLCTDGIVEAMNEESQQFGQKRLEEIVRRMARHPVPELTHAIGDAVSAHYIGESPPDDLTVLCVRRNA